MTPVRAARSPKDLTQRQREILILMCEGKTSKEMTTILWISEKTIESHRYGLCKKLRTGRMALMVRWAIRHGMIEP